MNPINPWAPDSNSSTQPIHNFRKQAQIAKPSETWVTIDENPASINDGWFVCDPTRGTAGAWVDIPATYHNRAGGIAFADGHSEIKKWKDRNVLNLAVPPAAKDPAYNDLLWLQERTTSRQ